MLNIFCNGCEKGKIYSIHAFQSENAALWAPDMDSILAIGRLGAGWELGNGQEALFQLQGFQWLPEGLETFGASRVARLLALRDIAAGLLELQPIKRAYSLAVITLSDKGARALRVDSSGPEIIRLISENLEISLLENFLIPDEAGLLKALLADLAYNQKFDLVCTTGGTGIGPRDITPQVTESLLDVSLPGFSQSMMAASLAETPNAMLSRSLAGLMANTLVINLPGSPRAVRCNLKAVLPALGHALEKAAGDNSDCGGN